MHLRCFALLFAAIATALPAIPVTDISTAETHAAPEAGLVLRDGSTGANLESRWKADLTGRTFVGGGWTVVIKQWTPLVTSKLHAHIPTKAKDITELGMIVWRLFTRTNPMSTHASEINDGWLIEAWAGDQHFPIHDWPRELVLALVKAACYAAKDDYPANGFFYEIWSANYGEVLLRLTLTPRFDNGF
ncbi:hypothetical protein BGZ61DRAFT_487257 [Ilyonectria robusta]|uniref:uncharacterized protein n=1 Tax=Ilyonectria robusta TaxID=1079257 RepID=UPI001E8E44C9|nr:uncharacterized protein BGZ61DRAFT_487257 [Ilyonectria robusta]KAH8653281.1 hypothetical protein BGZ61DRAFT_487257 [Ilyonectria robusta]